MPTAQTPRVPAEVIDEAANRLLVAGYTNSPCEPVRDLIGAEDVQAAYAVQEVLTGARVEEGAAIVGRKIGLTSEAVQQQLGVSQPDFGILFDNMAYMSGDTIPFEAVLQPRVEAEIAFVLKHDLVDGPLDLEQIRTAVDFAVAALEVCGSRVRDWDISFADTVADNASSGAFVLGTERRTLGTFEPRDVQMTMRVTNQNDANGTGAACLGDPLLALQWLAVRARELGAPLLAGQVILSGALGPMRPVQPGAVAHAEITGLGSVSVRFSSKDI
ncbi:2-keto-4-pentenoate hydratase [Nocardioides pocheonensis]|uniref:2-keto-4-pentenoate hydratase n=1 Tax=Nocardioides pocheonensis TaxID=661485 RepID=A0A3N0GIS2_9ACTN|nr:fumarylacetoacetate hydrolase family protein [Nocardioides pocheonensis]RNM12106.1 2-keto-4-pentenoate hydratase [Nocardioides pocheonensis]